MGAKITKLMAFGIIFSMLMIAIPSFAGEKSLTATWQQVLPSPNDLLAWALWYSEDQVTWMWHADIYYVQEQTEYVSEFAFTSPDDERKTWYFRMNAVDTSGNTSGWSNIASITIDFETPPAPINLKLTIKIISQ
jgi:hypothetical protein